MGFWIVGAGGVGREARDVAEAAGLLVDGFLDDDRAGDEVAGLPVMAPETLAKGSRYLVAIGDPTSRLELAHRLDVLGGTPNDLVHPRAVIAPDVTLEGGCLIMGLAHVSSSVAIARHVHVQYGATVGHDCVLEEGAIVLPGANIAGSVRLCRGSLVGSGAVVLQGLTIGAGAIVGAGAVVTRGVEPGAVVVGSPARPVNR